MTFRKSKLLPLSLIVALALTLLAWYTGSSTSDAFALTSDHAALSVEPDSQAVMAVSIGSRTSAPVKLSFGHLPTGITATATPAGEDSSIEVVALTASSTAKLGSFPLIITGTSGSVQHSLTVPAVVALPATHVPPPFTVILRPSVRTVVSRGSTSYGVFFHPGRPATTPTMSIDGLPIGATYSFVKLNWPNQAAYRLNVHTTIDVAPGNYLLTVHVTVGSNSTTGQAYLDVVNAVIKNFTISGDAAHELFPGKTSPINLAIDNTFTLALTVTNLQVTLQGTSNSGCTTSNFSVTQYTGSATLTIPAHTKMKLSQLGVPTSEWPQITMLDLPVDQQQCKNVTLSLSYSGSGSGT